SVAGEIGGTLAATDFNTTRYRTGSPELTTPTGIPSSHTDFIASTSIGTATGLNQVVGDLPRLPLEASNHPCRVSGADKTVLFQKNNGRGTTPSNPIQICNGDQLTDMTTAPNAGLHYRLAGYVSAFTPFTQLGPNFGGSIDG